MVQRTIGSQGIHRTWSFVFYYSTADLVTERLLPRYVSLMSVITVLSGVLLSIFRLSLVVYSADSDVKWFVEVIIWLI